MKKQSLKLTGKQSKQKQREGINENLLALIFIFVGIFISLSLRTDSMGMVGAFVKYIFLGIFSKLAILISFLFIFAGVYKLIYAERFSYKGIQKLPYILSFFLIMLIYALFNREFFPKHTPLSIENARMIFLQSNRGQGIGMLAAVLIFYLERLIGFYGSTFAAAALATFLLIRYFKMDVQQTISELRQFPAGFISLAGNLLRRMKNFVMVEEVIGEEEKENIVWEKEDPILNLTQSDSPIPKPEVKRQKKGNEQKKISEGYIYPVTDSLRSYQNVFRKEASVQGKGAKILESTLLNFGVDAKVKNISQGPTITRYELEPKAGTKVSKITNLTEDLALALAAQTIRIEAPIPGKSLIGIEVPNEKPEMVSFREMMESVEFLKSDAEISFALGRDIAGKIIVADIAKMPHMLIAGATGSGKSVCINTLICSILYKYTPDEVKMIMVDPKMVELSVYNQIPHLLVPVVIDMKKAPSALNWAVAEMNRRYKLFAENRVKDINSYNEKGGDRLPRIVIIVDELADLMMVSPKEIEDAIARLAQMARACGMHLVLATQRPSVDVITGLIKANIPSRVAFAVSSQMDSRTILDAVGAEKLLGRGDMLYYPIGMSKPLRVQGAFISEEEVMSVTDFIREHNTEEANTQISEEMESMQREKKDETEEDPLMEEVIAFITEKGQASASMLQRKFKIGYNRAARIVEQLEQRGLVGPADGSRPRRVHIEKE